MSGASIEEMLDLWAAGLRDVKARLRPLFAHPSVADAAAACLDGLLGPERRKTGWMRAEAAGDAGPWRQQVVLATGTRMRCAISCASMSSRAWPHQTPCW